MKTAATTCGVNQCESRATSAGLCLRHFAMARGTAQTTEAQTARRILDANTPGGAEKKERQEEKSDMAKKARCEKAADGAFGCVNPAGHNGRCKVRDLATGTKKRPDAAKAANKTHAKGAATGKPTAGTQRRAPLGAGERDAEAAGRGLTGDAENAQPDNAPPPAAGSRDISAAELPGDDAALWAALAVAEIAGVGAVQLGTGALMRSPVDDDLWYVVDGNAHLVEGVTLRLGPGLVNRKSEIGNLPAGRQVANRKPACRQAGRK